MTLGIAKILGMKKILALSEKLDIYDEIPELYQFPWVLLKQL